MRRARCTSISPGTFSVWSSPYSRPRSGRPERIGLLPGALLALTARLAGTRPKAHLLLHHLREVLRALAQRFERAALAVDGTVCIAVAERAFGVAHGVAGAAERIEIALPLLALTLLALLALLAEAALLEFFQQLLQLVAQRLLVLLQFAVLIALLAVLTLLALLSALAALPRR